MHEIQAKVRLLQEFDFRAKSGRVVFLGCAEVPVLPKDVLELDWNEVLAEWQSQNLQDGLRLRLKVFDVEDENWL